MYSDFLNTRENIELRTILEKEIDHPLAFLMYGKESAHWKYWVWGLGG